jgi:hypothetical protein
MISSSFASYSSLTVLDLLGEVRAKLAAVEFALLSFSVSAGEEERREQLRQRAGENGWLRLYLDCTREQLLKKEEQLLKKEEQLQEEKLLLMRKEADEREGECLSAALVCVAQSLLRRQETEKLQGEQRAGSSAMGRHGKRIICVCVALPGVVHVLSELLAVVLC